MAEQVKEQEINEELIAQYLGREDEDDSVFQEETPIPLSYKGVVDEDMDGVIPYDTDKFEKGVRDYSYIAGAFTALRNSGMSEDSVMRWLLGEVEVKCLDKQLKSQEVVAKYQSELEKKNEL